MLSKTKKHTNTVPVLIALQTAWSPRQKQHTSTVPVLVVLLLMPRAVVYGSHKLERNEKEVSPKEAIIRDIVEVPIYDSAP